MNIPPAQPVPGHSRQPDQQSLCGCHDMLDCPYQATTPINAAQLARVAELLDVLDGFLRRADSIADYLHATGRDHPQTPHWAAYDANPAHRPGQLHCPRPPRPPSQTATVNTRHR